LVRYFQTEVHLPNRKEGTMNALRGSIVIIVILGLIVFVSTTNSSAQELAKEQVVVYGMPAGDVGPVDPVGPGSVAVHTAPVTHHVYDALVRHPIGDGSSPEFEPDLATNWEVSPDKLSWTFHLRKGVKWHVGFGEVTAEDIVYSLNRSKNSKVSAWRANYANFKEIKAIDKYTVQITTAKPDPFLLSKVANYYGGMIVCKEATEKAGAFDRLLGLTKEEFVGTGPCIFSEYKPKDRIVLVRNDDYWKGKFIIEKLIFRYIPDAGAREAALLKGELADTLGLYDAKWIRFMRSKGLIVTPLGPGDLKALYFNLTVKPLDDKRVREAIAWGIGQEEAVKQQGEEISRILTSPVISDAWGHIDAGWAKYKKRDPEKAKQLLAEAGYPNGFTIKLFMSTGPWFLDKMVLYQGLLREIGINLEMTLVDDPIYQANVFKDLNPIVIKGGRYALATYWLRYFYHTESIVNTPKASNNFMHYSNPEVDRLIELAETTFDKKAQLDALAKVQRIVVEDLVSVPVVETLLPDIRSPWLDLGYEPKSNFITLEEIGPKTRILKH
jgi:peptide/nickel transport system substrate-binding protein